MRRGRERQDRARRRAAAPVCVYVPVWLLLACCGPGPSSGPRAAAAVQEGEGGAPEATWWSLRPLARPTVPRPAPADPHAAAENPIDRFLLARLGAEGLTFSAEAERYTLIRRLYYDLIGLPPAAAEVDAFLASTNPLAYEALVDRLLTSPHHGERWARHWLDLVHYADTHGYDKDKPRENAWPYRDYVIRALNQDKPYGRFVREQVAGDVLYPQTTDGIVATGFLAAGPWDFIGHVEVPETKIDGRIARNLDRDDMASTTLNVFASTTIQCARCHDHMFDPLTQRDYYRFQALFAALDRADRPYEPDPAIGARRRALEREERALVAALEGATGPVGTASRGAAADPAAAAAKLAGVRRALAELPPAGRVYAGTVHHGEGTFRGRAGLGPRLIHILRRGDVTRPGEEVAPGLPVLFARDAPQGDLPPGAPEGERRVALAEWLTDTANPLTWRSIVNRVWLHHFGRGLVDTANDFGRMGALPSHPELLDWLAVEFRDGGRWIPTAQSLKDLHRLIVTSRVYRQRSNADRAAATAVDADNRLLWRMNRRRLDAEQVRDSILDASGRLDHTRFGPGFRDFVLEKPEHSPHYEYGRHDPDDPATRRRTIYRFVARSQPQPFLATLDCADPSLLVAQRTGTNGPLQALALLNNPFVLAMAAHLAARVAQEEARELGARVERACRLVLGRSVEPAVHRELTRYAESFGLVNLARVLWNLDAFLFVD